jgi:type VI secretion system protein ImpG
MVRPMRLKDIHVEDTHDGMSALILKIQPDRNVNFESLDLDRLSLYLHGAYRLKYTLLLYLTSYTRSIEVREINDSKSEFQKIDHFVLGLPGLSEGLEGEEDDFSLIPYARQVFRGYRLLHEYLAYPERFFFIDVVGLNKFDASGQEYPFEVKFNFDHKLSTEFRPTSKDILINCVPIVNLFDRSTEEVSVTQRMPEYYIIPDIDRRKSKEIYAVKRVSGISENKLLQYTYTPVTSYDILDTTDAEYEFKRFYSTVYRPVAGDMAECAIRLFGPSMEQDIFPKETLSIEATLSNGLLPSKYLQVGSITEPINFPEGIQGTNITIPSEVLPFPERKNYLWILISHLTMSYTTLADTDTFKTILSLYNWSQSQINPNKKKIQEGIVKVHTPQTRYIHRARGLIRGIEFKVDIDAQKFENGEGDIHLFGLILRSFLSQYITINSFVILSFTDIETHKQYTWKPNLGKILPV